ncbi:MAG: hypothetical protein AAFV78_08025 [Bacteroidota bacterium]
MQISQFIRILFIAILSLLLSSCLTIEERYTCNKDGSGVMEYIVDMSELKDMLPDPEEGESPVGESDGPNEDSLALESIQGIDQIQPLKDNENYRFGISFHFANLQALNEALNTILADELNEGEYHTFFTKEGGQITRHAGPKSQDMKSLFEEELGDEEESGVDMEALMQAIKYKQSFSFASPIQVAYAKHEVEIQSNKLIVSADLKSIAGQTGKRNTTIVLKK